MTESEDAAKDWKPHRVLAGHDDREGTEDPVRLARIPCAGHHAKKPVEQSESVIAESA